MEEMKKMAVSEKAEQETERNAACKSRREPAKISETWAQETIADLDDFIESQGIYIRQ